MAQIRGEYRVYEPPFILILYQDFSHCEVIYFFVTFSDAVVLNLNEHWHHFVLAETRSYNAHPGAFANCIFTTLVVNAVLVWKSGMRNEHIY